MPDPFDPIPKSTGLYSAPDAPGMSSTEWIALGLCGIWFVGCVAFFGVMGGAAQIMQGGSTLQFVMVLIAVFLPVAVVLMVAAAARSVRMMRAESQRLQAVVDHMRQTFEEEAKARKAGLQPSVEDRLEEIASAARTAESAVMTFTSRRDVALAKTPLDPPERPFQDDPQKDLELGLSNAAPTVATREDVIKALNFPDTAEDKAGFAALRRALDDRKIGFVVRSAQDVLTLLSEDGIYMDDLRPDRARPELWRRFAHGDRGAMITALGGVRDRSSLALTSGRMRQDTVFRDSAHHFLRRFDEMLQNFEVDATDAEISALTNTRSARAFMLIGRVAGIFD